ncbi:MAG: hypothetical protein MZV49_07945 [Rhodopseudomonas palustris]|nr:hypothetical protein [Rhodopseudomonas palustris]
MLDPGAPFLELSTLAGYMLDDADPGKSVPGGGVIAGIGFVGGMRCMIMRQRLRHRRRRAAADGPGQDRCARRRSRCENKLPFVHLVESRRRQPAALPASRTSSTAAALFCNLARLSAAGHAGGRPSCTARPPRAAPTCRACRTTSIMVRGRAQRLPGRPAAAQGRHRRDRHRGRTRRRRDAHRGLGPRRVPRRGRRATRIAHRARADRRGCDWDRAEPGRDRPRSSRRATPPTSCSASCPMDYRAAGRHARGHRAHRRRLGLHSSSSADYGPATVVRPRAHRTATPVGIITNNGPLDPAGANKATHFIQACCQSASPLLYLQNTTGYIVGKA